MTRSKLASALAAIEARSKSATTPTMEPPPFIIEYALSTPWRASGRSGVHVYRVKMRLVSVEDVGPTYEMIAVLADHDAPPHPIKRGPPTRVEIAWFALPEGIADGHITAAVAE